MVGVANAGGLTGRRTGTITQVDAVDAEQEGRRIQAHDPGSQTSRKRGLFAERQAWLR
jgi:hypothetical protein